jgi:hypothetical protein
VHPLIYLEAQLLKEGKVETSRFLEELRKHHLVAEFPFSAETRLKDLGVL